jgi:hypothetical protein
MQKFLGNVIGKMGMATTMQVIKKTSYDLRKFLKHLINHNFS